MIQRIQSIAVLTLAFASWASAQQQPLDRSEILGRLAVGYSPSYVAHLTKTRGVSFSPSADFLSRVKLAGGDGILVERLGSTDAAPAIHAASAERAYDLLAKCAELLHIGDQEQAAKKCPASLDENPESAWPVMAALRALAANEINPQERVALLRQAIARDPNLLIAHRALASADVSPEERAEEAKQVAALGPQQAADSDVVPGALAGDVPSASESQVSDLTPESRKSLQSEIQSALLERPDLATTHLGVAVRYAMLGDPQNAQREFQEALRLEPDNFYLRIAIAAYDQSQHDVEAELAQYREAVRIAPYEDIPRRQLADALVRNNREADAVIEWLAFLSLVPRDVAASNALITLYLNRQDRKSAIAELRRSLKASSLLFADESKFVDDRFRDLHRLGELLKENREADAAAEQYVYLLRFKPDDWSVHNDYANVLLDQRKVDQAIDEYNQALRLEPNNATAHHNIGICLAMKNNIDGAITEFRQAQEFNPEEPHNQVFLGISLAQKGDLNGATDQFQQAIRNNPKDAEAHMGFAHALALLKDTSAAIDELKVALELQADFPAAENDLAWIYATADDAKFRDPGQALVLARRAVKTSPQPNAAFLDTLAEALLLNRHPAEALSVELQAAKLDPQNSELLARLPRFREAAEPQAAR